MRGVRIAMLKNLQGRDDLPTREFGLSTRTSERHQGLDDVHVALVGAVVRFHAPDRQNNVLVDAISGFDLIQKRPVFNELLLAHGEAFRRNGAVYIFAHRLLVFGLKLGGLDHLIVERDARRGPLEGVPAHASPFGCRPEALYTGVKPVRIGRSGDGHGRKTCQTSR